ncbi:MAG: chemotaxis protein CheX [Magnetococcales bacterium]|nr:chemotaxis protein CheX [Magnetococcales bacterium]
MRNCDQLQSIILSVTEAAMMEIVNTMLFIDVSPSHALPKPAKVAYVQAPAEVSVIVGFSGGIDGGTRLACSTHIACVLASALAGEKYRELGEEAKDAFAEVGNMLAGGIQTKLTSKMRLDEVHMSTPTIVSGSNYEIDYRGVIESVRHFFRLEYEPFYVDVYYDRN